MALVASVDYVAKRIYLTVDTVDADLDTLDVYREVRTLRRTTEAHRQFLPIIEAGGHLTKIVGTSYTPSYVSLRHGARIVPYDLVDHKIRLIRDTFTDDGFAGRDCFDRSGLSVQVDIDVDFPEVEIREVAVGPSVVDIWSHLLDGSHTAQAVMLILASVAAGKTSITPVVGVDDEADVIFRDLNDTKDSVTAHMVSSERTSITLNP